MFLICFAFPEKGFVSVHPQVNPRAELVHHEWEVACGESQTMVFRSSWGLIAQAAVFWSVYGEDKDSVELEWPRDLLGVCLLSEELWYWRTTKKRRFSPSLVLGSASLLPSLSRLLNTHFRGVIGSISLMTRLPDSESSKRGFRKFATPYLLREEKHFHNRDWCKSDVLSSPELDKVNETEHPAAPCS